MHYEIVRTRKHLELVLKEFKKQGWGAIDTETVAAFGFEGEPKAALIFGRMQVSIISMTLPDFSSYVIVTSAFEHGFPSPYEFSQPLNELALDKTVEKVFHNFNYDQMAFLTMGVPEWLNYKDTMLETWAIHADKSKSLKDQAPLIGRHLNETSTVKFDNLADLAHYAAEDTLTTMELRMVHQTGKIDRPRYVVLLREDGTYRKAKFPIRESVRSKALVLDQFHSMFLDLQEYPYLDSVIKAERVGFPIIPEKFKIGYKKAAKDVVRTRLQMYKMAGKEFNINSTKQTAEVLSGLGVDIVRTTPKGAPQLNAQSKMELKDEHPVVGLLIEHDAISTLISNYLGPRGVMYYQNKDTKRIHPSIGSVGSKTGRNTCTNPNLMQQPSRKDRYSIKGCYGFPKLLIKNPKEDYLKGRDALVVLDQGQLEMRVMAGYSLDPIMVEILADASRDIHGENAEYFGVLRNPTAKNLGFLLLYGGGGWMLSENLTMAGVPTTVGQASAYKNAHDDRYVNIPAFRKFLVDYYKANQFVYYASGRKRHLDGRFSDHKLETTLSNNVVQGYGQDLIKSTVLRCDFERPNPDAAALKLRSKKEYWVNSVKEEVELHWHIAAMYAEKVESARKLFKKTNTEFIMQVHDEVIFITNGGQEVAEAIAEIMTWRHLLPPVWFSYQIPFVAEGGVGRTWEEAKKIENVHSRHIVWDANAQVI